MDDIKDVFSNIYENWGFGVWLHSRSGPGSTLHETEEIRKEIRKLIDEKEIKSVAWVCKIKVLIQ